MPQHPALLPNAPPTPPQHPIDLGAFFPTNPGQNYSERRRLKPLLPKTPKPAPVMRGDVRKGPAPGGWGNFFPAEPLPTPMPYPGGGGGYQPMPMPGMGGYQPIDPGFNIQPDPGYFPAEPMPAPISYGRGDVMPGPAPGGWGGFEGSLPQAPNPWQYFLQQLRGQQRPPWRM